jgi:hypothetical protein
MDVVSETEWAPALEEIRAEEKRTTRAAAALENWEDSPPDRPQGDPYTWWRRHDEYERS